MLVSIFLTPTASVGTSCNALLNPAEFAVYDGIQYKVLTQSRVDITEVSGADDIVIGFNRAGHTSLYFGGHKLDSKGIPPWYVASNIQKTIDFQGAVLIVLKNTSERERQSLLSSIEAYSTRWRPTCVGVTCSYLKTPGGVVRKEFFGPAGFLRYLLEVRRQHTEDVDILTLKDQRLEGLLEMFDGQIRETVEVRAVLLGAGGLVVGFYGVAAGAYYGLSKLIEALF